MRFPDLNGVLDAGSRLLEPNVRIGVTGLRRAGKTVFVTTLVDNLLKAGRLPFLDVVASGRFQASRLRPQPDPDVPRFDVEGHLAALTGPDPHWPEPTRGIGQLRLALRYRPGSALKRAVQPVSTLNLDIVDYPGEWLLDLPLLRQSFAEWSALTLNLAGQPPRDALSQSWRGWLATIDPAAPAEEEAARRGAALYTDYLHACRRADTLLSLIQPGRFVEPGDMKDAPLLTFCPLPGEARGRGSLGRGSLWALMDARYEAYKTNVVRRFFTDHFARLDRQIVLIDVLGALNAGPSGMADMKRALELSLEPFRHGSSGWLDWLLGTKIDKVLFAATKADHIAAHQHAHLRALLDRLVGDARSAIRFEGAAVETMAIAALKCTESVVTEHEGRQLRCVRGVPVGRDRPTVLFPGEIPEDADAFPPGRDKPYNFLPFRPPDDLGRDPRGLPHIRVDQALQFLLGDYLE
ncbi:YcjX family protein [Azospirillum doebereinerae]|uniref:YcjX family protein n=1 Tax=Azospirillum doebereinerae TaxID=92933 RepID=A0A433J1P1_9PROT|nr:YcjX family protein [Azospirillum doebereinerae]